ncbi:MAG TPA: acyltransferase [Acidobacteriaceae bacterium]|jgi:peptidoglycan/LPS O-acetylase OafA/YrhL
MNQSSAIAPSVRPRIEPLTSVRFVAAISVVIYHYWPEFFPDVSTPRLFVSGFMGVSFFYVLSGYILGVVYLRARPARIDRKRFWTARFARVYPSYALALILRIPLIAGIIVSSENIPRRLVIAIGSLVANLALLQAWYPVLDWRWNPPSWSVSAEAFFYLLFPLLAIWSAKVVNLSRVAILCIVSYCVMLVPPTLLLLHGIGFNSQPRPEAFLFVVFAPIFRIPEFMIGLFLCGLEKKIKEKALQQVTLERVAAVTLAVSSAAVLGVVWSGDRIPFVLRYNGIADLAFAGIIVGLANYHGLICRVFSTRAFILLGEASYAVYILQSPLRDYVDFVASKMGVSFGSASRLADTLIFGCYLALLIGISIVCYLYIEAPLRRGIMRMYNARTGRPGIVDANPLVELSTASGKDGSATSTTGA